MKPYLDIVNKVLNKGIKKESRTVVNTIAVAGAMFEHDMEDGFPLVTTKKVPFRLITLELEQFIRGITDKKWLQERNSHIWDKWCNPEIVPYGHDEETKQKMCEERDLGPIYGWQWRNFGAKYEGYDKDYTNKGIDQLKQLIETLKKKPYDRRMIVSAWNPNDLSKMALPPCYYGFQVTVLDGRLNLMWNERSSDVALGLPFDIAVHGLLLHLLAKETGLKEGKLVGFIGDTHIYENHIQGLKEQLRREPYKLPKIETKDFKSIFDWKHTDSKIIDYKYHDKIKFDISV